MRSIGELVAEVNDILRTFLPLEELDGVSVHINIRADKILHPTLRELDNQGFSDLDIIEGTTIYERVDEESIGECHMQVTFTLGTDK